MEFFIKPVGIIHSEIKTIEEAPLFYTEGAPDAVIEIFPEFWEALLRVEKNIEIIILTWLHLSDRNILQVHPRGDKSNPLTGVFFTRSPDRPNPIGLHRVKIKEINNNNLRVGPLEAINGTPVIDIKCVVETNDN